jgi:hypothetical protein
VDGPGGSERDSIDWEPLMDGRLRRLKRGVHYRGSVHVLAREAKVAAEELGRTAIVYKDLLGRFEYLWVQFLDGKVEVGQPCPRCRAAALERRQEFFAFCPSCGSMHVLSDAPAVTDDTGGIRPLIDVVMTRVVTPGGEPTEAVSVLDEAVIELSCHFSRPLSVRQVLLTFFVNGRKLFRAGCPEGVTVDRPQTVDFTLHLDAGVLLPGDYQVFTAVHATETATPQLTKFDHPEPLVFTVRDPRPRMAEEAPLVERSHLHWEVDVLPLPAEVAGA